MKNNLKCVIIKQEFIEHPIYCTQLLLKYGSEPEISQRLCYWVHALKRVCFHTKFNRFLFPFDPLLVWHEAGVILLISAGGSRFHTTMTEHALAPGENTTVPECIFVTSACAYPSACGCICFYEWVCERVHAFLCVRNAFSSHSNIFVFKQHVGLNLCWLILAKLMVCMLTVPDMASCNIS